MEMITLYSFMAGACVDFEGVYWDLHTSASMEVSNLK